MILAGISRSMIFWNTVLTAMDFSLSNINLHQDCHQFDDDEWRPRSLPCIRLYIATLAGGVSCATLATPSPRAGIVIATNSPLSLGSVAPLAAQRKSHRVKPFAIKHKSITDVASV